MDDRTKILDKVKNSVRITKIIATRSVKGSGGDTFVGFTAAWDTVQDDGSLGSFEPSDGPSVSGLTWDEAQIASVLLSMKVDMAAFRNAEANGTISSVYASDNIRALKSNYSKLLDNLMSNIFGV